MATIAGQAIESGCVSCRQPLTGRYCAHCGEKVLDPDTLTVKHFVTETLTDELIHLDGKFWRTVRTLMFRPGLLSNEYSAGRRRPYITPVRLLIAAIITFAVLTRGGLIVTLMIGWLHLSTAPTSVPNSVSVQETVRQIDRFGVLKKSLAEKQQSVDVNSPGVREKFHDTLNQCPTALVCERSTAGACPVCAVSPPRTLLLDHAVFSMHLVTFVLMSSLALVPTVWLLEDHETVALIIILSVAAWQFAYVTIAIRQFYFDRGPRVVWPRLYAVAAALLVYILNSTFITAVQMAGGAIALRSL